MNQKINTSWIEISKDSYSKNIDFFRSRILNGADISVVIKANAYGHGILETAQIATECGIEIFCVNSLKEALELRKAGFDQRIIVLGPIMIIMLEEAVKNDLECVCYNIENLNELSKAANRAGKNAVIHLKIETGTNRQGIAGKELESFLNVLRSKENVILKGVYSHFANIEDTTDHSYAQYQMETFRQEVARINDAGFSDYDLHFASSAAAVIFQKTHFSMIRLGISQYGLWPSKETYLTYITEHGHGPEHVLSPVMTWKTVISQIKTVPSGQYVGYGCTRQLTRDSKIAVLPIGYSDGYDRKLSDNGYVLVHGKRAPVLGRIAMNLTMIDITDIPETKLEDEVILIGEDQGQIIRAEHMASLIGTINYEVVTRIPEHIPRVVV
jgi:alanine racemase